MSSQSPASSIATVDQVLSALATPIPGPEPAGSDLREHALYSAIEQVLDLQYPAALQKFNDAQRAAALARIDWDWVRHTALTLLITESRDLRLAVWAAKAMAALQGLPGVRDGLRVVRALHTHALASMHPRADLGMRTGRISWLAQQLAEEVELAPLFRDKNDREYSYQGLKQAGPQAVTLVQGADADSLAAGRALLADIAAEAAALEVFKKEYEPQLLTLRELKDAVTRCQQLLSSPTEGRGAASATSAKLDDAATPARNQGPRDAGSGCPPADREQALGQLQMVADYFRSAEPQSPLPYLIERAIRWATRPLTDWLKEVLDKKEVLQQVMVTLGISETESKK